MNSGCAISVVTRSTGQRGWRRALGQREPVGRYRQVRGSSGLRPWFTTASGIQSQQARYLSFWYCWLVDNTSALVSG